MRIRARYVIAALLLIPLADILLLLWLATTVITPVQTVAVVVLTGLVGMLLVRAEGRHTLRKLERKLATGDIPTQELLDGALLIAAGAFLLTPGVVTDAIGFLLALPPTRYPVRRVLETYVLKPYLDRKTDGFATGAVWTAGFPNDGSDSGGGPGGSGGFGPGGFGPSDDGDSGGFGPADTGGASGDGDDVVDVDPEHYSVDSDDSDSENA